VEELQRKQRFKIVSSLTSSKFYVYLLSKALIVDGFEAEVSDFPWNVAVYKDEVLICGGNIVSGFIKILFT
jgi:hypothetical protein